MQPSSWHSRALVWRSDLLPTRGRRSRSWVGKRESGIRRQPNLILVGLLEDCATASRRAWSSFADSGRPLFVSTGNLLELVPLYIPAFESHWSW